MMRREEVGSIFVRLYLNAPQGEMTAKPMLDVDMRHNAV